MSDSADLIKRMFDEAVRHHRTGHLADAEHAYQKILAAEPHHADSLHLLGMVAFHTGRGETALDLIGKAIAIKPDDAAYHSNRGIVLGGLGKAAEAEASFLQALALDPARAEAHGNLANILARRGELGEAVAYYETALSLNPKLANACASYGNVLRSLGKLDEAAARYAQALALDPTRAETHSHLGSVFETQGRLDDAMTRYEEALRLNPNLADAHNNLGNILKRQDKVDAALAHYEQALALDPNFADAHYNLAIVFLERKTLDRALVHCARALELNPDIIEAHHNLGLILNGLGRWTEAEREFQHVLALRPKDPDAHVALANALQLQGRLDEAMQHYRDANELRVLTKRPGAKSKPDFDVLALNTPAAGNTPSDYLLGRGSYDSYFLTLMTEATYDLDLLRSSADVIVNLISDVDRCRDVLRYAADLVDAIGRPAINHPRKILETGRDMIAQRLQGIPACRIPKTIRVTGDALTLENIPNTRADFAFPVLVRVSGAHGGNDFEKCDDDDAIVRFAVANPTADFYITAYAPYESPDGYFRKYRLIYIDGQVLPYHLAVDDQWKVHHFRTAMDKHAWMRAEEEAFVADPTCVFRPQHWAALEAIRAVVDLDYFGIDCALDRDDNLLVFEVNATMRVHGDVGLFAYKQPYIARIKSAFDAMLARCARDGGR